MNTYKDQFTEWSPAYPVVFHVGVWVTCEDDFRQHTDCFEQTIHSHNITIKAINKAMNK